MQAQPLPAPQTQPAPVADPYGRSTPRGTVFGFLSACRKEEYDAARNYLNTRLPPERARELARQLATVLDRRLPARLNQLSDSPEGSLPFPERPNIDLVGTVDTRDGAVDILLQRVDRPKAGSVWLFSSETLALIPGLYKDLGSVPVERILPGFFVTHRILGIPLSEWLAFFIGLPLTYLIFTFLNWGLRPIAGAIRRRLRANPALRDPDLLPPPVRLLLLAVAIRWGLTSLTLPLLERQFWESVMKVLTIAGCTWLLIGLTKRVEQAMRRSLGQHDRLGAVSMLRFLRRTIDVLIVFTGVIVGVYAFGLNPTAAIAGLGVGGIAVALAAQKTLENVIGGISLVSDASVRIGDFLKIGDILGTVEDIGLRSTRIRSLDRTVLSVPNGQLANLTVENFSRRDKFWFHPRVPLQISAGSFETRRVLEGISRMLTENSAVERGTFRVNAINLGPSSLELEIFAYIFARDWPSFLKLQEDLLLKTIEIVNAAGARIAVPVQAVYLPDFADQQTQGASDTGPTHHSFASPEKN